MGEGGSLIQVIYWEGAALYTCYVFSISLCALSTNPLSSLHITLIKNKTSDVKVKCFIEGRGGGVAG